MANTHSGSFAGPGEAGGGGMGRGTGRLYLRTRSNTTGVPEDDRNGRGSHEIAPPETSLSSGSNQNGAHRLVSPRMT